MSVLAISDASIAISTPFVGDFFMSLPDDLVAVAMVPSFVEGHDDWMHNPFLIKAIIKP